jgi:vacuolar-type H+-ATPase subunit H
MAASEQTGAGWTLDAYIAHNEALRASQVQHDLDIKELRNDIAVERDRRYTEVKNAEEKALKIKEEADKTALGLQRDTQVYKDEKANELREQINSERGLYATKGDLIAATEKLEATVEPIVSFMRGKQGQEVGITGTVKVALAILSAVVALMTIYVFTQNADPVVIQPTATVPSQ